MLHFVQKKINSPEVARLEKLLTRLEAKWRVEFKKYIENATSELSLKRMADLIEAGRADAAIEFLESLSLKLAVDVIPPSFSLVGNAKIEAMGAKAHRINPMIAISFDPTYPRAVALQEMQKLDFIRGFNNDQRAVVNEVLQDAFQQGHNPLKAARTIRESIGLTPKQWKAVKNYRELLEDRSISALHRGLHDRRFLPAGTTEQDLQNYLDGLTPAQIDKMVERYTKNYHTYRAEVIARTESGRTLSEANREAFQQTVEQLQLPDSAIERTWNTTEDKRTRDSHVSMNGQKVIGMNTPFVTGAGHHLLYPCDPSGPAEEVIQCRCVETQDIGEVPDDYYD